jgi:transcription elongation GreA/GreB family factor
MPGYAAANLSTAAHRAYPMTQQAYDALSREVEELDLAIRQELVRGFSIENEGIPSTLRFPGQSVASKAKRLTALREVLAEAEVVRTRNVAIIGRRVTVSEPDGARERYSIVFPGDGDPANGWVAADSPIGAALLWATVGEHVVVYAPAGQRTVQILGIEAPASELARGDERPALPVSAQPLKKTRR